MELNPEHIDEGLRDEVAFPGSNTRVHVLNPFHRVSLQRGMMVLTLRVMSTRFVINTYGVARPVEDSPLPCLGRLETESPFDEKLEICRILRLDFRQIFFGSQE